MYLKNIRRILLLLASMGSMTAMKSVVLTQVVNKSPYPSTFFIVQCPEEHAEPSENRAIIDIPLTGRLVSLPGQADTKLQCPLLFTKEENMSLLLVGPQYAIPLNIDDLAEDTTHLSVILSEQGTLSFSTSSIASLQSKPLVIAHRDIAPDSSEEHTKLTTMRNLHQERRHVLLIPFKDPHANFVFHDTEELTVTARYISLPPRSSYTLEIPLVIAENDEENMLLLVDPKGTKIAYQADLRRLAPSSTLYIWDTGNVTFKQPQETVKVSSL